jgi:hypothetical protein
VSATKAAELAGRITDRVADLHGLTDIIEGDTIEDARTDPLHDNRVLVTLTSGTRLLIEVRPL